MNNDKLGNFRDHKPIKKILKAGDKPKKENCKNCYAKYLCGGTCYADIILKNRINENIRLYVKLKNLSLLDKFMKVLKTGEL